MEDNPGEVTSQAEALLSAMEAEVTATHMQDRRADSLLRNTGISVAFAVFLLFFSFSKSKTGPCNEG
jgi:hypothetical protein